MSKLVFLRTRQAQKGVTLVELVISIVIMSIAMVALLNAFGVGASQSADPLWRNKTLKIAQLYLDEILAKRYDEDTPVGGIPVVASPGCSASDIGADAGESNRADYDDVDDYDEIDNEAPNSLISSIDSSYSEYRVSVTVECLGSRVGAEDTSGSTSDNHAKRITLTITTPHNKTMTFAAYKGNF